MSFTKIRVRHFPWLTKQAIFRPVEILIQKALCIFANRIPGDIAKRLWMRSWAGRHHTVRAFGSFLLDYQHYNGFPELARIGTTQDCADCFPNGVYNRKEIRHPPKHVDFLVDCVDDGDPPPHSTRIFIPWATISFFSRNVRPEALLKPLRTCATQKDRFCCFMFGNTTLSPQARFRYEFYERFNRVIPVDQCSGVQRRSEHLFNEAVEIYRPYKFCIAFENADNKGWVTEKIVNAFLAGCIPLYCGPTDVTRFFNKKAFIDYHDFDSEASFIEHVLRVHRDNKLYESYLDQVICTEDNFRNLFRYRHPDFSDCSAA